MSDSGSSIGNDEEEAVITRAATTTTTDQHHSNHDTESDNSLHNPHDSALEDSTSQVAIDLGNMSVRSLIMLESGIIHDEPGAHITSEDYDTHQYHLLYGECESSHKEDESNSLPMMVSSRNNNKSSSSSNNNNHSSSSSSSSADSFVISSPASRLLALLAATSASSSAENNSSSSGIIINNDSSCGNNKNNNNHNRSRENMKPPTIEHPATFLGGATEELLVAHIFVFLNATELSTLASCSKYFGRITSTPKLWTNLLKIDFLLDSTEDNSSSSSNNTSSHRPQAQRYGLFSLSEALGGFRNHASANSLPTSLAPSNTTPKSYYIRKYKDVHNRIQGKREEKALYYRSVATHYKVSRIEWFLDLSLVRMLIPLPLLTIFASLLMIGLYYDGVGVPMWVCAVPVLFLFFYFFICVLMMFVVFNNRYRAGSSLAGIWGRLNCPIKTFYQDVFHESRKLISFAVFGILLGLLQVLLLAVKLSVHVTPTKIRQHLEWGIVFLPLWLLMAMYCISPAIRFITDRALYFSILFFLWGPLFISGVCVGVMLDGEDHHNKEGNIRLALIFMPLWVIEGLMMVGTLISFSIVYHRHLRYGLERQRVDEQIGTFSFISISFI
jgi:hypothetical protein